MKEIEIKILDIDVEMIRKKLIDIGTEQTFNGEVHWINYDFPDETLYNHGRILRIRKVGNQTEVCYKAKIEESKFKVREEIEVVTSNFEDTISIIEKIGFKKFHEGKKHRESYKLGNVKFEIDSLPGIPPYLEIEAPTEKEVANNVEKLGYTIEQTTNLSARQVIEQYKK